MIAVDVAVDVDVDVSVSVSVSVSGCRLWLKESFIKNGFREPLAPHVHCVNNFRIEYRENHKILSVEMLKID